MPTKRKTVRCAQCGADYVQITAWINANTEALCDGDAPTNDTYCPRCDGAVELTYTVEEDMSQDTRHEDDCIGTREEAIARFRSEQESHRRTLNELEHLRAILSREDITALANLGAAVLRARKLGELGVEEGQVCLAILAYEEAVADRVQRDAKTVLLALTRPLIKYLNDEHNPQTLVIVDTMGAHLLTEEHAIKVPWYMVDPT